MIQIIIKHCILQMVVHHEKYRDVMYGDLWIDYLKKDEYDKLFV